MITWPAWGARLVLVFLPLARRSFGELLPFPGSTASCIPAGLRALSARALRSPSGRRLVMPLVRYRKVAILGYRSVGESPPSREHQRTDALWPEEARCRGNVMRGANVAWEEVGFTARRWKGGGMLEEERSRVKVDRAVVASVVPALLWEQGSGQHLKGSGQHLKAQWRSTRGRHLQVSLGWCTISWGVLDLPKGEVGWGRKRFPATLLNASQ